MTRPGSPWVLSIHLVRGMTPVRIGLLVGVVLVPPSLLAGIPLVTPLMTSYALAISGYLVTRQQNEIDALLPLLAIDGRQVAEVKVRLFEHPRWVLWVGWIIGPTVMLLVNAAGPRLEQLRAGIRPDLELIWAMGLAALFWVIFWQVLTILYRNARLFSELGARHVRISVIEADALAAFGRVAVRNLLIFVGGFVISPFVLLEGSEYALAMTVSLLLTLPWCIAVLVLPLYPVYRRIVECKNKELQRIQQALAGDRAALRGSPIGADGDDVSVTSLVLYRDMVQRVSNWPVNAPVMLRFGAYVVVTLLAWIAAALVERLVDLFF